MPFTPRSKKSAFFRKVAFECEEILSMYDYLTAGELVKELFLISKQMDYTPIQLAHILRTYGKNIERRFDEQVLNGDRMIYILKGSDRIE